MRSPPAVTVAVSARLGSSEDDAATAPAATSTATTAAEDQGTFPATAEHRFGSTTVPKRPERIVVVGLTEQDTCWPSGYKPIATTEWYGEQPGAIWPWAREAMGDAKPTVLEATDGIPIEKVAALRPDLIIGTNSGMTRRTTTSSRSSPRRSPASRAAPTTSRPGTSRPC